MESRFKFVFNAGHFVTLTCLMLETNALAIVNQAVSTTSPSVSPQYAEKEVEKEIIERPLRPINEYDESAVSITMSYISTKNLGSFTDDSKDALTTSSSVPARDVDRDDENVFIGRPLIPYEDVNDSVTNDPMANSFTKNTEDSTVATLQSEYPNNSSNDDERLWGVRPLQPSGGSTTTITPGTNHQLQYRGPGIQNLISPGTLGHLRLLLTNIESLLRRMISPDTIELFLPQVISILSGDIFDFNNIVNADVIRFCVNLFDMPVNLRAFVMTNFSLNVFSPSQIRTMPIDVVTFHTHFFDENTNKDLSEDQLRELCQKMTDITTPLEYLSRSLRNGINCTGVLDRLDSMHTRSGSQAFVLLHYLRENIEIDKWSNKLFADVIEHFGNALTKDDIESLPIDVLLSSLQNTTKISMPRMSTRRAIVNKVIGSGGRIGISLRTLKTFSCFLDDLDPSQRSQILLSSLVDTINEGMKQEDVHQHSTSAWIDKVLSQIDRTKITKFLPWIKNNFTFIRDMPIRQVHEAIIGYNETIDVVTAHRIVEQLEQIDYFDIKQNTFGTLGKDTSNRQTVIGKLIEVIKLDVLQLFSSDSLQYLIGLVKPLSSKVKAKYIYNRLISDSSRMLLLQILQNLNYDLCNLFVGFNLEDIDKMSESHLIECMKYISHFELPEYIERKVVNKISPSLFEVQGSFGEAIERLGQHAKYLGTNLLPEIFGHLNITDYFNTNYGYLTKAQLYIVMDKVREQLSSRPVTFGLTFSASVLNKLGALVLGLTADDIWSLPLDLDFLSTVEILSEYEDRLDSSQVEAIVGKLRSFLQIADKRTIDVDYTIILRIGRFLQYFNPERELEKFLPELRPFIAHEIGKSSLLKVPQERRKSLLNFALKNTLADNAIQDIHMAESIDADDIMDLGSLMCGLTEQLINKLTQDAIDIHLHSLKKCPFKKTEMKALVTRALSFNINRLTSCEHLASMGQLLMEVTDADLSLLDTSELTRCSQYLVADMIESQNVIKTIEMNGLVRQYSEMDITDRQNKKERLLKFLFTSMKNTPGVISNCQIILSLQNMLVDVSDDIDTDMLEECIEYIGNVKWDQTAASNILNKMSPLYEKFTVNKDNKEEIFSFLMDYSPYLIAGLPADDFQHLNVTDDTIVAIGEVNTLSDEQVRNTVNRWLALRNGDTLTGDDIVKLQHLTCGLSPSFIRDHMNAGDIWFSLSTLGVVLKKCSREHLKAFADKLVSVSNGPIDTWPLSNIVEMGAMLGGLNKELLSNMSILQVKSIEPHVITNLPIENIQYFTTEQLLQMTANQKSAITSVQRSYLNEEQMKVLDSSHYSSTINQGGRNTHINVFTIVAFVLSMIRQCIFLEYI